MTNETTSVIIKLTLRNGETRCEKSKATKGPWKLNNEISKWEPVITLSEELNNYKWDNTKKYHSKQSKKIADNTQVFKLSRTSSKNDFKTSVLTYNF